MWRRCLEARTGSQQAKRVHFASHSAGSFCRKVFLQLSPARSQAKAFACPNFMSRVAQGSGALAEASFCLPVGTSPAASPGQGFVLLLWE